MRVCVLVLLCQGAFANVLYDLFLATPLSSERKFFLDKRHVLEQCTIEIEPCKKNEGRREDGTCTNPRHPARGASGSPLLRMLPPNYGHDNSLRRAVSGAELPSPRLVRTKLVADGPRADSPFTQLAAYTLFGISLDISDFRFINNYILGMNECCFGNKPNKHDPKCIAIDVPWDDPFLRRTGVGCINLRRFPTFQDRGCAPRHAPAEKFNLQTPLLDLSVTYGFTAERAKKARHYEGGLLRFETQDGVERPPNKALNCLFNREDEHTCFEFGDSHNGNYATGTTRLALWFNREHNRIARALAELNPCWNDQELYDTARQINIAQYQHVVYYELMPEILGRKNLLKSGVIYDTDGYVNDFDENLPPGVFHEFLAVMRIFHTFSDGRDDMYSPKGDYLGTRTAVDDQLRSGVFGLNHTEAALTQGIFRQMSATLDDIVDPDLGNRLYSHLQPASDAIAIDIMRGRDQGLQPYNAYRQFCGLPKAHKFEDFLDHISPDKVEQISRLYEDVNDVDLLTALYSGQHLEGTYTSFTFNCLLVKNLLHWRKSDRHFYEHGDLPTALTPLQLKEVRKATIARLICDNGVDVDMIQPHAFMKIGKGNELQHCKSLPTVDLRAWKDNKCHRHHQHQPHYHHDRGFKLW